MTRVGVMIEGQEGLTWDRWRAIAQTTERLGFDALWRSDHLFSLFDVPARPGLDTWASLTWLAASTQRIRFGPLVCPITFQHPSLLARQAAAVDVLSGGRLELGVGAGSYEREHHAFGIPYPRIAERVRRLDEAVQVIRALWKDSPASFNGRYYRLDGGVGSPKPAQGPAIPLIIGGRGPRVLEVVARHADEWNCGGARPRAEVRTRMDLLVRACARVGRDPKAIRRSWTGAFLIGENGAALERRARKILEYLPSRASVPAARLPEALRRDGWLVGGPEEIVAQVGALRAEGMERFMLECVDQEDLEALDLISEQVLPRLS